MDVETARGLLRRRGIELASNDSLLTFLLLNDLVLKGVLNPLFATHTNEMQEILRSKGIRICNDDPIFTLLALNGIVLRNSIDLARRTQIRIRSASRTSAGRGAPIGAALAFGFGVGVFFGINHIEPSRVFFAVIGSLLGISLGALGVLLVDNPNKQ